MWTKQRLTGFAGLFLVGFGLSAGAQPLREPLPLDVAVGLRAHNGRSPVDLSPDGEWLAHTYGRDETVPRQTLMFSATGVPFAEGNARMQAALTHTKTGQVIRLGGSTGSSWGAVWSPDGQRVAFYSDDDGEAGVWIWDKATARAARFPGVVVRPLFGFEVVRWSADGHKLLCKILPAGMTVAQTNALAPSPEAPRRFSPTAPDQPSVFVLRANVGPVQSKTSGATSTNALSDRALADLAILDLRSRRVVTRVERVRTTWYAWSPDQARIAYNDLAGTVPNSQQAIYRLVVLNPATGERRVVVDQFHSAYGIDVNWAPDGRRIAYVTSGQIGKGELQIVETTDAGRTTTARDVPSFNVGNGDLPPLWSTNGRSIYAVGTDGKLWHVDVASGRGTVAGDLPEHQLRMLIAHPDRTRVWSPDAEQTVWALGRQRGVAETGFYRISLGDRTVQRTFAEMKIYSMAFNVDVSDATGAIVYGTGDQRHPIDLWQFDTRLARVTQVTRLNEHLDRVELGVTHLIEWSTPDGQKLRGALLLPPGYEKKQRLPLVVWAYGGVNGSSSLNTFGLVGSPAFNLQVLATQGTRSSFPMRPSAKAARWRI